MVTSSEQAGATEVDPATWRHVELYLPGDASAGGGFDMAHWLSMHNGEALTIDRKTGTPPRRRLCRLR